MFVFRLAILSLIISQTAIAQTQVINGCDISPLKSEELLPIKLTVPLAVNPYLPPNFIAIRNEYDYYLQLIGAR